MFQMFQFSNAEEGECFAHLQRPATVLQVGARCSVLGAGCSLLGALKCRVPRSACRVPRAACRVPLAACRLDVPCSIHCCRWTAKSVHRSGILGRACPLLYATALWRRRYPPGGVLLQPFKLARFPFVAAYTHWSTSSGWSLRRWQCLRASAHRVPRATTFNVFLLFPIDNPHHSITILFYED